MNRKIFERIRATHTAWEADELASGEEAGRKFAETEASYTELLVVLADLPKAERVFRGGDADTTRLPELLGAWWSTLLTHEDYGMLDGDPSIAFQVGFMRGMVAVLTEYETELAKEWAAPKPSKERKAK